MNYYANQISPQDFIRHNEKRQITKTSNGLGIYILSYFLTMMISTTILSSIFSSYLKDTSFSFTVDIFVSVFSAFIPGLFYFLLSKNKPSQLIKTNRIGFLKMLPLLFIGMAFSMLSNIATSLVQSNMMFFGLENSIDFSNDVYSIQHMLLYFASTALVPAFAEEFAFRGILMGSLRKYGDAFAIVVSSVLFGAMHGNIVQIPFAFMLGLIFGYADCKANSILPSILIHFCNNFYSVLMDVLSSNTYLSDNIVMAIQYLLMAAFCIIGLLSFVYIAKTDKGFFKMTSTESNGYGNSNVLSLKEKIKASLLSPAIIVLLVLFLLEMVLYLMPTSA